MVEKPNDITADIGTRYMTVILPVTRDDCHRPQPLVPWTSRTRCRYRLIAQISFLLHTVGPLTRLPSAAPPRLTAAQLHCY